MIEKQIKKHMNIILIQIPLSIQGFPGSQALIHPSAVTAFMVWCLLYAQMAKICADFRMGIFV